MTKFIMRAMAAPAAVLAVLGTAVVATAAPNPAKLAFAPAPYGYGQVSTGSTASQVFTLTNSGGKASGKLSVKASGSSEFTITVNTCSGTSLDPGGSCTVTVQFAPTAPGTAAATLSAAVNRKVLATDALTGSGTSAHLYWTNFATLVAGAGSIGQAGLNGSSPHAVVSGLTGPRLMAVGADHIYWAEDDAIMQAGLDGSSPTTLVQGAGNTPYAVAVDSSHVYWVEQDEDFGTSTVNQANLDGSSPTTLANLPSGSFTDGVAVDSSHAYWANSGSGTIGACSLADCSATAATLVTGQLGAIGAAVDSSHIYWADPYTGTIMEAGLDGTGVTTLVSGQTSPEGVAVHGSHIYWADEASDTIMEASLDGTGVTQLVSGQTQPVGVAVGP